MRNQKLEMITCQYNILFLNFLFVSNIIMASHIKTTSILQKTIKSRIKKFTNAKLSIKISIKKLLSEQPFYKQPIKKPRIKKLTNQELLRELPFYDDIDILRNERIFRGYAETYKVEITNNRNLSDLSSVIKNSVKNLFDELLRKKGVLNIL